MKLRMISAVLGILLVFSVVSEVFAESAQGEGKQQTSSPETGVATLQDGTTLGKVKDFVVNPTTGQIAYAVIVPKENTGATKSVLVLPWSLVQVNPDRTIFRFMIDDPTVRGAPHVSMQTWEQAPVTQWVVAINTYWAPKVKPETLLLPSMGVIPCKVTALIGVDVQGDNNKHVGTIEELILDTNDGAVTHVLLSREDVPGNVVFFSLPWSVFYVEPKEHTVIALIGAKTMT